MRAHIERIVTEQWQARLPALLETLVRAADQVQHVLQMEEYHRGAYTGGEQLGRTMGGFANDTLDLASLSSVLRSSHKGQGLAKKRYEKLKALADGLATTLEAYRSQPPAPTFAQLTDGPAALLDAFEQHMAGVTTAFRSARIARLEARGKYDPAEHDAAFAEFDWRQLETDEMAQCPPFVVFSEPGQHASGYVGSLTDLLTSGRPVKVVLLQSALLHAPQESGRAAALQGITDASLLFLALRNVYFLQTSPVAETPLEQGVDAALASPRPAVLSLFAHDFGQPGFEERARLALQSRAFPHFVYDPERAADFVSRLNLADNPQPEALWVEAPFAYEDGDGERQELTRSLTFADFAVQEPEFADEFRPLAPEEEGRAVPLTEYLEMDVGRHWERVPFVYALDGSKAALQMVPSQTLLTQTLDRMHLWNTLQELSGIQNPYVQAAERRVREELEAAHAQALAKQREELEAQFHAQGQEQVSAAMRNLAQRLTGLGGADLAAPPPAPAAAAAPAAGATPAEAGTAATEAPPATPAPTSAAPAAAADEGPWIDPRLCTSCDECIDINKAIFVYNGNKKAVIKDARGGPYKDIVRAAEKCSSGAIHPGMPLDPGEKDLEKWVKRAEPFQ